MALLVTPYFAAISVFLKTPSFISFKNFFCFISRETDCCLRLMTSTYQLHKCGTFYKFRLQSWHVFQENSNHSHKTGSVPCCRNATCCPSSSPHTFSGGGTKETFCSIQKDGQHSIQTRHFPARENL